MGQPFSTRNVGRDIATIEFDGNTLVAYKSLLCRYSPFFDKALDGTFREGDESRVCVEGHADTVYHAIDWMFTQKLPAETQIQATDMTPFCSDMPDLIRATKNGASREFFCMTDLFAFADKYDIPLLRNQIVRPMYHSFFTKPYRWTSLESCDVWVVTNCSIPVTSAYFRLMVDVFVRGNNNTFSDRSTSKAQGWHLIDQDFWAAVGITAMELRTLGANLLDDDPIPPLVDYLD